MTDAVGCPICSEATQIDRGLFGGAGVRKATLRADATGSAGVNPLGRRD